MRAVLPESMDFGADVPPNFDSKFSRRSRLTYNDQANSRAGGGRTWGTRWPHTDPDPGRVKAAEEPRVSFEPAGALESKTDAFRVGQQQQPEIPRTRSVFEWTGASDSVGAVGAWNRNMSAALKLVT